VLSSTMYTLLIHERPILRGLWISVGNSAQNNGLAVGKFSDERQVASHSLDALSQGRKQKIASLFETGYAVLADAEGFGQAYLSELTRSSKFLKGHLLRNESSGAGLDLLPTLGAEAFYLLVYGLHGLCFLSFLKLSKWPSNRSSAFAMRFL